MLETGMLDFCGTDIIDSIITRLIILFLQQNDETNNIADKQIQLVWRTLHPETYNLQATDTEKALEAVIKPFNAKFAQDARIRRMMLFLSPVVEPVGETNSVLKGEIKLREERGDNDRNNYKKDKGYEEHYELNRTNLESYFVGKYPYSFAEVAFNRLKMKTPFLSDLTIEAVQVCDLFLGRKKKYILRINCAS